MYFVEQDAMYEMQTTCVVEIIANKKLLTLMLVILVVKEM